MNKRAETIKRFFNDGKALPVILCSSLFIFGAILGRIMADGVSDAALDELARGVSSVRDFFRDGFFVAPPLLKAALTALIFPVFCAFCGFSALGFPLVLAAAALRGFALCFSVSALLRALGTGAWSFAFCLYGVPELLRLPFFLLICAWSFDSSLRFCRSLTGARHRRSGPRPTLAAALPLLLCLAAFALASLTQAFISPLLVALLCR